MDYAAAAYEAAEELTMRAVPWKSGASAARKAPNLQPVLRSGTCEPVFVLPSLNLLAHRAAKHVFPLELPPAAQVRRQLQHLDALVLAERSDVLPHHLRHAHRDSCCVTLPSHLLQLFRRIQGKEHLLDQAVCIAGSEEMHGNPFMLRQIPKVSDARRDARDSILRREMRHAARSSGRGVGHHREACVAKQIGNRILGHITEEMNSLICMEFRHRLHVARRLRMIAATDYQLDVGYLHCNPIERFDQQFETLISSPLSKRKNAVGRVSSARKVWRIGPPGKNAMRFHADPAPPVLLTQRSAIGGHQHGERV